MPPYSGTQSPLVSMAAIEPNSTAVSGSKRLVIRSLAVRCPELCTFATASGRSESNRFFFADLSRVSGVLSIFFQAQFGLQFNYLGSIGLIFLLGVCLGVRIKCRAILDLVSSGKMMSSKENVRPAFSPEEASRISSA